MYLRHLLFFLIFWVLNSQAQPTLGVNWEANGDGLFIEINGEPGTQYDLQKSFNLIDFETVESISMSSSTWTTEITFSDERAFFRLIEVSSDPTTNPDLPKTVDLVEIPSGSFVMGNNAATGPIAADFKPERQVHMSAFSMSEAEITNQQYVDFLNAAFSKGWIEIFEPQAGPTGKYVVGSAASSYSGHKLVDLSGFRVLKDHDGDGTIDPENPLNQSWIEFNPGTQTFSVKDPAGMNWDTFDYQPGESRSDWEDLAEGKLPQLAEIAQWPATFIKWYGAHAFADFYGLSLPTEAQWEYAAQGGLAYEYPSDDGTMDATKANYNENNLHPDPGHVVSVKSYPPNPFGLYDMAGNVWEWCADWYDPTFYATSPDPDTDPFNEALILGTTEPIESVDFTGGPGQPYNGDTKVKRGGSWNFHIATLASSARERDFTWRGNDHFGFRVVMNVSE